MLDFKEIERGQRGYQGTTEKSGTETKGRKEETGRDRKRRRSGRGEEEGEEEGTRVALGYTTLVMTRAGEAPAR